MQGSSLDCPSCGRPFKIPAPAPTSPAQTAVAEEEQSPSGPLVTFFCQDCGQKLKADVQWGGRTVSCPSCLKPQTVPQQQDVKSKPSLSIKKAITRPRATQRFTPMPPAKKSSTSLGLIIAAVLIVIVGVVILICVITNSSQQTSLQQGGTVAGKEQGGSINTRIGSHQGLPGETEAAKGKESIPRISTSEGKSYTNCVVDKVEGDWAVVRHSGGVTRLRLFELPADLRAKYIAEAMAARKASTPSTPTAAGSETTGNQKAGGGASWQK
jgi:hypothetical protein